MINPSDALFRCPSRFENGKTGRWHRRPPDFIIRGPHRYVAVNIEGDNGMAKALVTPGWQGKTGYCYRIAGARQSEPQFGGVGIFQGDEEFYSRSKVWSVSRPRTVVL